MERQAVEPSFLNQSSQKMGWGREMVIEALQMGSSIIKLSAKTICDGQIGILEKVRNLIGDVYC